MLFCLLACSQNMIVTYADSDEKHCEENCTPDPSVYKILDGM